MDVEEHRVSPQWKNIVLMIWILLSTIVYGTTCICMAPFSKRASKFFGKLWNRHLLFFTGVKIVVTGTEHLDSSKRYVFIANHQSHLDIPVLFNALPHQLSFIAKKELFQIPLFGWALHVVGHIWIDRTNPRKAIASIKRAVERLKNENISLVLFPEGTRSADGKIGQLKQGSFSLVQQAGAEVVPVVIHDTCRILAKYSKKLYKGTVHVTITQPLIFDPALSKAEIAEMVRKVLVSTFEAKNGSIA